MYNIPGTSFTFSAVKPETLTETEYTLVSLVVDITGSVYSFAPQLLQTVKTAIDACKKNPRSENLLVRLTTFEGGNVKEVHGFKPLSTIDSNDYKPFRCGGNTNLYDATIDAIGATEQYAINLNNNDFNVNSAVYIITDGEDNDSQSTSKDVRAYVDKLRSAEAYGQLNSVLIGINAGSCAKSLDKFKNEANLDQFVDVGDATPGKLAKLAGFISKSISSTSQALNNGTAPVSLTF